MFDYVNICSIDEVLTMTNNNQVSINTNSLVSLLQMENQRLKTQLGYEKKLRVEAEKKVIVLEEQLAKKKRKKKENANQEYSPYKCNGRKKPQKTDPITSREDYIRIREALLKQANGVRNATIWTLGIALGLRVSDLAKLKWKYFLDEDLSFKVKTVIHEQKTSKLNNIYITEIIQKALLEYMAYLDYNIDMDDFIFKGYRDGHLKENTIYTKLKPLNEQLNLQFHLATHTMRKSFACIAACCGITKVDMNTLPVVQGLLNHSSQTVTMRYLGIFDTMYEEAREKVSDFLLGKTNINKLIMTNDSTNQVYDKIVNMLDEIIQQQ